MRKSRQVTVGALLLVWIAGASPRIADAWITAVRTPAASGMPASALHYLMDNVLEECPAAPRLLLLSDDPRGWMQGSYLIYPRRIDVIQQVDGFTSADLDTHSGGCLMWYRSQAARLGPFGPRLALVRCLDEGCLYRVR